MQPCSHMPEKLDFVRGAYYALPSACCKASVSCECGWRCHVAHPGTTKTLSECMHNKSIAGSCVRACWLALGSKCGRDACTEHSGLALAKTLYSSIYTQPDDHKIGRDFEPRHAATPRDQGSPTRDLDGRLADLLGMMWVAHVWKLP